MDVILKREWRQSGEQDRVPTAADVQSGTAKFLSA